MFGLSKHGLGLEGLCASAQRYPHLSAVPYLVSLPVETLPIAPK